MPGLARSLILFLSVTQFILGMLGNGFIGMVNGSSWFKSKRISLSDFILTTLALCRIVVLGILFADCTILVFSPSLHEMAETMQVIDLFWTFTNHLSTWLATCLSVFYCLKIASFSHPTFLWLKWRVSRVVGWMLWGALLSSCGSLVTLVQEFKLHSVLRGGDGTGNVSEHFRKQKNQFQLTHVLGMLRNLPLLVLCLAACLLLILSLGRHTRQMQQGAVGPSDPSTDAHKRAIRMILSFVFLFLLYFVAISITTSSYFLPGEGEMTKMIGQIISMFYPVYHSFVLILGNNRLRQTFVELLWCESGHLKPVPKGPLSP